MGGRALAYGKWVGEREEVMSEMVTYVTICLERANSCLSMTEGRDTVVGLTQSGNVLADLRTIGGETRVHEADPGSSGDRPRRRLHVDSV